MESLCKALLQIANSLNGAATELMLLRVLNEKDMLENMLLTRHGDKKDPSSRKWRHELTLRVLEAVKPWSDSLRPEDRFNHHVFTKEWDDVEWDDKKNLLVIEDDCRSLNFLIQSWVYRRNTSEVDEDIFLTLHAKAIALYSLASAMVGFWHGEWEAAIKRTKGALKTEFNSVIKRRCVFELLKNTKGKISSPLLKKAQKQTGKSERRVREYIKDVKNDPYYASILNGTEKDDKPETKG